MKQIFIPLSTCKQLDISAIQTSISSSFQDCVNILYPEDIRIVGEEEWEEFEEAGEVGPDPIVVNSCTDFFGVWFGCIPERLSFPLSLHKFLCYVAIKIGYGDLVVIVVNDVYFMVGSDEEVFRWGVYEINVSSGKLVNSPIIPTRDLEKLKAGNIQDTLLFVIKE